MEFRGSLEYYESGGPGPGFFGSLKYYNSVR